MRGLLTLQGFSDLIVLADRGVEQSEIPTRENILRAFSTLQQRTGNGDLVFLYFSGHGARQPAQPLEDVQEEDGWDEVWLPADTGTLQPDGRIENAIVDDEVGRFITACRQKGAFVWIVVDACHSGGSDRAASSLEGARLRGLSLADLAPEGLAMPSLLAHWISKVPVIGRSLGRVQFGACSDAHVDSLPGGLAAFFACRSESKTPELPLPLESPQARYMGLFTHVFWTELDSVLQQSPEQATFLALISRIRRNYAENWIRYNWEPQLCGDPPSAVSKRRLFT